ncbi:mannitol dehydrogenase family protein [Actinomyces ruminis]|uniref:Mannitol dehydrogenase family protein n=1 Tax=Actinomyces ruminis TaxID=1937003 RepID=A0ABX4MBJ9_9ACTO|nr:mannitol dehydrogenase family protein [Actinomyces ruminis]PHP52806.1 mannitol dehydrogenase family protein [Actinomyces ruminis]
MRLTIDGLQDRDAYRDAGVAVPAFDVAAMQAAGRARPRWLHLGAGNIFRVFLARIADDLIAAGHHWPITGVVTTDPAGFDARLGAHDLLTLSVTLNPDGGRDLRAIAGLSEGLATRREADLARLFMLAGDPEVTLVSLTITEKGYAVHDGAGRLLPEVADAVATGPRGYQSHAMALLAGLLLTRYEAGGAPITLMSCDNFSHNGDRLREAIDVVARGWVDAGTAPEVFLDWLADPTRVAFPITVIDKITPRPSPAVSEDLARLGFTDMGLTAHGRTPQAGFVNTEPTEYLIIEDAFAAARPPFEQARAHVVAREVCDDFENMKVTTCLNPLHTALAVAGCLLRMPTIDAEMRDPALAALVNRLGWDEGLPVVSDPGVVAPADFLTEVLGTRFTNPYLPDDPARIAMDTSQKLPIRFGQTLLRYRDRGLEMDTLTAIPLVIALWCRYLTGIADDGAPFTPSSDPRYEELHAHVADLRLDGSAEVGVVHAALQPILSDPTLFALDLYTTPLAAKIEALTTQLFAGPGAVRATIEEEMLP